MLVKTKDSKKTLIYFEKYSYILRRKIGFDCEFEIINWNIG